MAKTISLGDCEVQVGSYVNYSMANDPKSGIFEVSCQDPNNTARIIGSNENGTQFTLDKCCCKPVVQGVDFKEIKKPYNYGFVWILI